MAALHSLSFFAVCLSVVALSLPMPANLPPTIKELIEMKISNPSLLAAHIRASPLAAIQKEVTIPDPPEAPLATLPIVVAHGMGDSCFNPGMESITKASGVQLGVYSVCIPTGDNQMSDTINGFLLSMDKSVDVFAAKVRADPKLAKGFNAYGLSQGNNVIRGYITKYK